MRTRFERAPGVSFISIGIQPGFCRGVEIDNPSGSWLYIPSLETFIEPYTSGWSFGFPYEVAGIDILVPLTGPAGQVSTVQGDNVVVYLTDQQIPNAAGSPTSDHTFIETMQSAQLGFSTAIVFCRTIGALANTTIIVGVPNKRIRIVSLAAWVLKVGAFGFYTHYDSDADIAFYDNPATAVPLEFTIHRQRPFREVFIPGLDWSKGAPVESNGRSYFGDINVAVTGQYVLI